ncbi:MAG: GPW/gp25 family protein [Planctomycetota bacterium]
MRSDTDGAYRAFRFRHPDSEGPESSGFCCDARGAIEMVQGAASVQQAILLLLSTEPGERVMRPTYGCELRQLVFSPNDDTTAGLAVHYVRRALDRWEPRIEVLRIDARRPVGAPERMVVEIEYRVRATGQVARLAHELNVAGG